jgi:hypothetical protein
MGTTRSVIASGTPASVAIRLSRIVQMFTGDAPSSAAVRTGAGTGFPHRYCGKQWDLFFEGSPDPAGNDFTGWILEAGYFVETTVVNNVMYFLRRGFEVSVIYEIPSVFRDFAGDFNLNVKRVAMQTSALVPFRKTGQPVGRFETKVFGE